MYIYSIYSKTMANFAFSGMASGRVFRLGIRYSPPIQRVLWSCFPAYGRKWMGC